MNTPTNLQSKTQSLESTVSCMCISIMRDNFDELQALLEIARTKFDLSDTNEKYVKALRQQPLEAAVGYGRMDMIEYLLPHSSFENTDILTAAIWAKEWDALERVIPYHTPQQLEKSIVWATKNKRWSAVEYITPHIQRSSGILEEILAEASAYKKQNAMLALYSICDPNAALEWGRKKFSSNDLLTLSGHHTIQEEYKRLKQAVGGAGVEHRKAKI